MRLLLSGGSVKSAMLGISSNVQAVADYKAGKETAIKFLVGQVMKATKGRANPALVNEELKKKLTSGLNTGKEG